MLKSAPDGFGIDPNFIVFVENAASETYLCNATGDAMVWDFELIGEPLTFDNQEVG